MNDSTIDPLSESVITYRQHDPSFLLHMPQQPSQQQSRQSQQQQRHESQSRKQPSMHSSYHVNLTSISYENLLAASNYSMLASSTTQLFPTAASSAAQHWERHAKQRPAPTAAAAGSTFNNNKNNSRQYSSPLSLYASTPSTNAARQQQQQQQQQQHQNQQLNRPNQANQPLHPQIMNPIPQLSPTNHSSHHHPHHPTYAAHILAAESRIDAAGNAYTSYLMNVEITSPPQQQQQQQQQQQYSNSRLQSSPTSSEQNSSSPSSLQQSLQSSQQSLQQSSQQTWSQQQSYHQPTMPATTTQLQTQPTSVVQQIIIEHRYSEFLQLQNQLLANHIYIRAPFPKKHWAGNLALLSSSPGKKSGVGVGVGVGEEEHHYYCCEEVGMGNGSNNSNQATNNTATMAVTTTHTSGGRGGMAAPSITAKGVVAERASQSRMELIEVRKVKLDMWLNELCRELNNGGGGRLSSRGVLLVDHHDTTGDEDGNDGSDDEKRETNNDNGNNNGNGNCSIVANNEKEMIEEDGWEDVSAMSVPSPTTTSTTTTKRTAKKAPPTLREQVIEFLTVSSANRPPCNRYNPVDWDELFTAHQFQQNQQQQNHGKQLSEPRQQHHYSSKANITSPTKIDKDATGIQKYLSNPISATLGSGIRAATYTLMNMCGMRSQTNDVVSSSSTLHAMNTSDRAIPLDLLKQAKGLVFLSVVKGGFVISGRVGTGLIISRLDSNGGKLSKVQWSPPSAIGTVGVGWGALVGGDIASYLIVLTTHKAVAAFSSTSGTVNLGAELSVAVGPLGRGASSNINTSGEDMSPTSLAPAYAYVHSKGLFVGISIESSVVSVRRDVNAKFYGREVEVEDLLAGRIESPRAAQPLYDALDWCLEMEHPRELHRHNQFMSLPSIANGGGCFGGRTDGLVDSHDESVNFPSSNRYNDMSYNGRNYGDSSFYGSQHCSPSIPRTMESNY